MMWEVGQPSCNHKTAQWCPRHTPQQVLRASRTVTPALNRLPRMSDEEESKSPSGQALGCLFRFLQLSTILNKKRKHRVFTLLVITRIIKRERECQALTELKAMY